MRACLLASTLSSVLSVGANVDYGKLGVLLMQEPELLLFTTKTYPLLPKAVFFFYFIPCVTSGGQSLPW